MHPWPARCPTCRGELGPLTGGSDAELTCAGCGASYRAEGGVWRFLRDDRRPVIEDFLADYERIRHAEGRAVRDPHRWRALPDVPADDPLAAQWRMRARSFDHLVRTVVGPAGSGLRVLDLGAGVGWVSHRLAELGHHPCAVDLSADPLDGLGVAVAMGAPWPCVQAEFDDLPLLDDVADLVVFDASFHYAADPVAVLHETRRLLAPGGRFVVMDSPLYRSDAAGRAMVAERRADFERRFGTRSDRLGSIEYLTTDLLDRLAVTTGVRWQRSQPWYGWRWWWRPWSARLRCRRQPSRFVTLVGRFD